MKNNITIGIPAFNEENNISKLIDNLLAQKIKTAMLKEIIIISDGSTDKTNKILSKLKNSKLKIIIHKKRLGLMHTQNEIIKLSNSKLLVLLDADVLPKNNIFLDEIIKPIQNDNKIGIVGANTESLNGKNLFEKVIAESHEYKKSIYFNLDNKNNLYLCHGRARAFNKDFYKKINWPNNAPEDSFSYLFCIKSGFKFIYQNSATVLFRSPNNYIDHKRQSDRFFNGNNQLKMIFGNKIVENELIIPLTLKIKITLKYLINSPLLISLYFMLYLYLNKFSKKYNQSIHKWEMTLSSKNLN